MKGEKAKNHKDSAENMKNIFDLDMLGKGNVTHQLREIVDNKQKTYEKVKQNLWAYQNSQKCSLYSKQFI